MTLYAYRVGQPYVAGRTSWPEIVEYNYRQASHELRLFFKSPTRREVDAVATGTAEFALLPYRDVLFFLYRFGTVIDWSDAPYSWHLLQQQFPDQATLPAPLAESEQARDTLQVILIDAATGLIRVLRVVSFSPAFTVALRLAIRAQAATPWPGPTAYDRQHQEAYRRYPTSQAMLAAATARTVGGS